MFINWSFLHIGVHLFTGVKSLIETRGHISRVLNALMIKHKCGEYGLEFICCSSIVILSVLAESKEVAKISVVIHRVRHHFIAQILQLFIPDLEQIGRIKRAQAEEIVFEDRVVHIKLFRVFRNIDHDCCCKA